MDPNRLSTASEAHPETMDFLSRAWCNFAVQTLQPEQLQDHAIVLRDFPAKGSVDDTQPMVPKMERSVSMEDQDTSPMPQWQSNDLKSWIWMQQAMHPELNYNAGFKKKWPFSWKMPPLKNVKQIKKWAKEIKEKRKEGKRLERAEVHAAVSIAGLAAALAAVAAEKPDEGKDDEDRETALASAATLVAAQCAQMAELMGAKREQLSTVIGSAITGTNTADILTLTAAAATSLRGAHALKARTGGCVNRRSVPVLPIQDTKDVDLDFEKNRSVLARGARLTVETSEGRCMVRVVSLHLNNETKIILKIKKLNFFKVTTSKKESIVLDQHIELYRDAEGDEDETCYQISLTTTRGIIRLDMADDYQKCRTWTCTINQMLRLSSSLTKYELQLCKY